ncbi:MAG: VOC family protein [Flavobacteriaceae bacterium]|nr:VOC family protein [Bacteroidia bacterium]MBT8287777.1 VOC family protein [Bacteroidia bacterium]NNF75415.1 VOC family protein [Flavobacteriaceae bacterium]NNK72249.1 VOC family protein [Flavobacteriaceae bacterium]
MKQLFIILITFVLTNQIIAQSFKLEYDHTAIPVSDLDKSSAFYGEILKLKEIRTPGDNPILRWFDLGNNRQLHLIENNSEILLNKGVHFALNATDLKAFIDHLQQNNIPFEDWLGSKETVASRPDGVKQIYIQDPDGHWIEINDASY